MYSYWELNPDPSPRDAAMIGYGRTKMRREDRPGTWPAFPISQIRR